MPLLVVSQTMTPLPHQWDEKEVKQKTTLFFLLNENQHLHMNQNYQELYLFLVAFLVLAFERLQKILGCSIDRNILSIPFPIGEISSCDHLR